MTVLEQGIPAALAQAGVDAEQVVGLGIDVTSCTVLPVDADGLPLCTLERWRNRRHAWPKLWKHHAAQPVADRLNEVATSRGETFLSRYGGRISSEWYFPKLIEVWAEDREVYDAMYGFLEATDWIVWHLTGSEHRQRLHRRLQGDVVGDGGLPSDSYFEEAFPGFADPGEKLGTRFSRSARCAARFVPTWLRGSGSLRRSPSRWGTSTRSYRCREPASRSRGRS